MEPDYDDLDREGLLAHLTHFVPSLCAITDVLVSHLPGAATADTSAQPIAAPTSSPSARLLRFLSWLGPVPRIVAPAIWLAIHGVHPGSPEKLRQTCDRRLPGLLPHGFGPRLTDDVRAAMLLAYAIWPSEPFS